MRIFTKLFGSLPAMAFLAGCGHHAEPPRPRPPAPFAYLSLAACKSYPDNIVECQLEYGPTSDASVWARPAEGPVDRS
ncbi:hypothetical protein AJ87_12805 [Rhizobium yanglingense]|nr:hypothetical protein AJ87_12805 [Rhizobium yanglingense]